MMRVTLHMVEMQNPNVCMAAMLAPVSLSPRGE